MQLRFKNQQFQADACSAVCNVFEGQPNSTPLVYLRDVGRAQTFRGMEAMFGAAQMEASEGYANAGIVLSTDELLDNVKRIQRANRIPESSLLSADIGAVQLDIEMETGTGKTYVYTKTMFELNKRYGWTKFVIVSKNHEPQAVIEYKKIGSGGTVRKVVGRFDTGDSIYDVCR